MGLRFRKSIKIAPGVKLNLNKGSVGLSAGVRGARVSVNSKGRVTKSVGIPGSGLSYVTTSKIGGKKTKREKKESGGSKGVWGIVVILLIVIIALLVKMYVL